MPVASAAPQICGFAQVSGIGADAGLCGLRIRRSIEKRQCANSRSVRIAKGRQWHRACTGVAQVTSVSAALACLLAGAAAAPSQVCPTREAIERELAQLQGSMPPNLIVEDDGARFTVATDDFSREFVDTRRNCVVRAQDAAVFLSMTFQRALVAAPKPLVPKAVAPSVTVVKPVPWQLDALAIASLPAGVASGVSGGATAKLSLGDTPLEALVAAGASHSTLAVSSVGVRLTRVPLEAGALLTRRWRVLAF